MYSILLADENIKKGKGVSRTTLAKAITHEHYVNCLVQESIQLDLMKSFKSLNHQINSTTINKISLNPVDDKRYYLNAFESIPYGHHSIKK